MSQLHSNEGYNNHLNAGIRLKTACIQPVNAERKCMRAYVSVNMRMQITAHSQYSFCAEHMRLVLLPSCRPINRRCFQLNFSFGKKRYEQNDLLSTAFPSLGQTVRFGETLQRIAIYGNHHFSPRGLWLPPAPHPLPSPLHGPSRLFLVTILADCYPGNRISVIARRQ